MIDTDGLALGLHVLAAAKRQGGGVVYLSHIDVGDKAVVADGYPVCPPVRPYYHSYVKAMQELHAKAGIFSGLSAATIDPETHFTLDGDMAVGVDYGVSTLIAYKIDSRKLKSAAAKAAKLQEKVELAHVD